MGQPIIIGGQLNGRRPPDFHGRQRNHTLAHDWVNKHAATALLNPNVIYPQNRILWHGQYLTDVAPNWFNALLDNVKRAYAPWGEFVRRFLMRFDEPQWRERAMEEFNAIKRVGQYKDISA